MVDPVKASFTFLILRVNLSGRWNDILLRKRVSEVTWRSSQSANKELSGPHINCSEPWFLHVETGACFGAVVKRNEVRYKKGEKGTSLVVQWLGLRAFTAEGPGSVPGWGTEIPQAVRGSQKNFFLIFRQRERTPVEGQRPGLDSASR